MTFKSFITSGTHIFAYGLLILLQLPLHLPVLILNGKNIGLLLLTLTIYGLVLHSWLIIEIHSNELTFVRFDRIVNPIKITFLTHPNIFIYTMSLFFIKYLWMPLISSTVIAS